MGLFREVSAGVSIKKLSPFDTIHVIGKNESVGHHPYMWGRLISITIYVHTLTPSGAFGGYDVVPEEQLRNN